MRLPVGPALSRLSRYSRRRRFSRMAMNSISGVIDAPARVVHLGDVAPGLRAAGFPLQVEAQLRQFRVCQPLPAVERARAAKLLRVAALLYPPIAQRRKSRADVDPRGRVGIGARGVVDEDRRVRLRAHGSRRVGLRDLAHRHADVRARSFDIDLARARQRLHGGLVDACVGSDEIRGGRSLGLLQLCQRAGRPAGEVSDNASYAGMTRIRF